jgi:hypothetical protein
MCGSPAWQALGAQTWGMNNVQACAGLEGMAQCNGDHAMFVSLAQQALGAWASIAEIMQGHTGPGVLTQQNRECMYLHCGRPWGMAQQSRDTAGLCRPGGVWSGRDCKSLWIPSLKGSSHRDRAVLRGGSLG